MFIHNIWVILAQEATNFLHSYSTHAQLPSNVHGELSSLWALPGLLLNGSAKVQSAEKVLGSKTSLKIWTDICMVESTRKVLKVPYFALQLLKNVVFHNTARNCLFVLGFCLEFR